MEPAAGIRMEPAGQPSSLAMAQLQIPGVPSLLLEVLADAAAGDRLALVGGAVRDLLLHRVHNDPWRGLPDLDLVVEPEGDEAAAPLLARRLAASGRLPLCTWSEHGAYGTVEIALQLSGGDGEAQAKAGVEPGGLTVLLDVATARREIYPVAGENPVVSFGSLEDDLARRDFTINAMALLLGDRLLLLDPHGGQRDLAQRLLRFLHPDSLRDDPSRLIRAARYQARLGFQLAPDSLDQVNSTLNRWPWPWRPGDPADQAPAALGTRLRMELELLLERERWPAALEALQGWGALVLLDAALQADRSWRRRLLWAERLGLPRIAAFLALADDPPALAARLQLPHRQQRLLAAFLTLRRQLADPAAPEPSTPSAWAEWLEAPGRPPECVALALAAALGPRRPLLRWWLRWRHLRAAISAKELIELGVPAGPALGERLRLLRAERLDQERL